MKQVALITGSTRGIGAAIAQRFIKEGITVITHGTKDFDVSVPESVQAGCAKFLQKYGHIDILVNNAGIMRDRSLMKMSFEEWDSVIKTNLYGTFNVTQSLLPNMIKNNFGRIINLSSIVAHKGTFGKTNYAAAKAGIIGFTKSLAQEVAKYHITVNAICPGLIDTAMSRSVPEKYLAAEIAKIPLGRMGKPQEVAAIVTYLASKDSAYLTGQAIDLNGGWT
jgi:NAD(P)-dependent dehydrogenase (short-subunit alcohol dehydrogenase family)